MARKRISISVFQIFIALLIIIVVVTIVIVVKKNVNFEQIGVSKELEKDFAGSGTKEDPYKIEKIEDLVKLSEKVNMGESYTNQYFELIDKLDFQNDESYANANSKYGDLNRDGKIENIKTELTTNDGFQTIGDTEEHLFEGNFNGNDQTIKNLLIYANSQNENIMAGLFGNNKGTISNVRVIGNITVNGSLENKKIYIGMIAAKNEGLVQACKTEGEIKESITNPNNVIEVAGIVANNKGKIADSSSSVNITASQLKAGITAQNIVASDIENSGDIINCTNAGDIKEEIGSEYYTAGIVADNKQGNITSCNNTGSVEGRIAGGIVGKSTGYIVACQNAGNICNVKEESNDTEFAGGIVGILDTTTVENCKNTGNISGLTNVGGIAGKNSGTIVQSRNEGDISKISGTTGKTVNLGGLVGKNSPTAKLANSKNYGGVSSETDNLVNLGGICGVIYNNSTVELCENNGTLKGSAKIITPNEDVSLHCTSCTNNNGGNAETADYGELNIGIIYGKFEEK